MARSCRHDQRPLSRIAQSIELLRSGGLSILNTQSKRYLFFLFSVVCVVSQSGKAFAQTEGVNAQPSQQGLIGGWFGQANFQHLKGLDRLQALNVNWSSDQQDNTDRGKEWSALWEGTLTAPISGKVRFYLTSDHLSSITIGKKRLFASQGVMFSSKPVERSATIPMKQGQPYPIKIRYAHRKGNSFLRIQWSWDGKEKFAIPANYLSHSTSQAEKWNARLSNRDALSDTISNQQIPQPLTDWSAWPQSYSLLMNEKAMFPVDTSFWKMKLDTSRQLFVDNHVLSGISNLEREFHQAKKHAANPVFDDYVHGGYIWPNPEGGYRLYYNQYRLTEGDIIVQSVRLAVSDDGIHWTKPDLNLPLDLEKNKQQGTIRIFTQEHIGEQNNVLIPHAMLNGIYHEPENPNPNERWKAVVRDYSVGYTRWEAPFLETKDFSFKGGGLEAPMRDDEDQTSVEVFAVNKLFISPDGLHWHEKEEILPQIKTGRFILDLPAGNKFPLAIGAALRTRWDPALKKYIAHTKHVIGPDWRFDPVLKGRAQGMMESDDLVHWSSPRITVYPDSEDAKVPGMYGIYESDGFHYQSMWLGCLSMIAYRPQDEGQLEKEHWIRLSGSRDGRHWYYLGNRDPFIPAGAENQWDTHYMRMANLATTGGPIQVGDELWFYYWGRDQGQSYPKHRLHLGIAKLRKDGFASLNAGENQGAAATRPFIFTGKGNLYVNADVAAGGHIKAEVLDEYGNPLDGYSLSDSLPITGNHTTVNLAWKNNRDLSSLKDQHIRLVFYLKHAKLYSFWIK